MKIKINDAETKAQVIVNLYLLETSLKKIVDVLSSDYDYAKELEETPWLDRNTFALNDIADAVHSASTAANAINEHMPEFEPCEAAMLLVDFLLYFEGNFLTLKNAVETGAGASDEDMEAWKIYAYKRYRTLVGILPQLLESNKLYELKANGEKLPYEFELFENYTGVDAIEYCLSLEQFTKEHPINGAYLVAKYLKDLEKHIDPNSGLVANDILSNAELVMPYDIIAILRGDLIIDNAYVTRLENRADNPGSVVNSNSEIIEITDRIDEADAVRVYKYEDSITSWDIRNIADGKTTMKEVLVRIESELNKDVAGSTDLFSS